MMKDEFDAKIGVVSSELLYARAEHVYLESDLFVHQGQLIDFYKTFGTRGINHLYFTVVYADNWIRRCQAAALREEESWRHYRKL
jgi:hypothetical protein